MGKEFATARRRYSLLAGVFVGITMLASCGQQPSGAVEITGSQSGASPSPLGQRGVIIEQLQRAPIALFFGSRADHSVIRATVDMVGDPYYAGSPRGDDPNGQTIYTPFTLSNVSFLRGPRGALDVVAVEGGAIGDDRVTVAGGALEVASGIDVYAVVTAPGTRVVGPAEALVSHFFPVLDSGQVFVPENMVLQGVSPDDAADARYVDRRGVDHSGRQVSRGAFESAARRS